MQCRLLAQEINLCQHHTAHIKLQEHLLIFLTGKVHTIMSQPEHLLETLMKMTFHHQKSICTSARHYIRSIPATELLF